jgi:large subunit ribosomal protein L4
MVGGGTVFGPQPRDYGYRLPRSARRSALRSALALRLQEGALVVLDKFELGAPKTKSVVDYAGKVGKSVLIVDSENKNLGLSARNIKKTKYLLADALNVYDILDHEILVVTQAALDVVVGKAAVEGKKEKRANAEAAA